MAIHYSKKEEIINSSSHGVGILLGMVVGGLFLWWSRKLQATQFLFTFNH